MSPTDLSTDYAIRLAPDDIVSLAKTVSIGIKHGNNGLLRIRRELNAAQKQALAEGGPQDIWLSPYEVRSLHSIVEEALSRTEFKSRNATTDAARATGQSDYKSLLNVNVELLEVMADIAEDQQVTS